jgi:hypothetical protein
MNGFLVFPAGGVDKAGSSHHRRFGKNGGHVVFLSDSGAPSHAATDEPFPSL